VAMQIMGRGTAMPSTAMNGEDVAAYVDEIKASAGRGGELLPLLSERHPAYRDRQPGEILRIRGYAMAALEHTGLPSGALPYVLEALESEFHPYLVAGAARALRTMSPRHPKAADYLLKAVCNIWTSDGPVNFDSYEVAWPLKEVSSGVMEILRTLAAFGASARRILPELERLRLMSSGELSDATLAVFDETINAIRSCEREPVLDCCELPSSLIFEKTPAERAIPGGPVLQDQDGAHLRWHDFFTGKPVILAFFYTRCGNPRKCSQTIFHLATIREALLRRGLVDKVRVAAITYDPDFDTAEALRSYGATRGFRFDEDSRMFRVSSGFQQIVQTLELGVNFTGSQVNGHRIEFFLLNASGETVSAFVRLQIDPEQIVTAAQDLVSNSALRCPQTSLEGSLSRGINATASFALGVITAILPKCPACWASYMSAFGVAGSGAIPYTPWLFTAVAAALVANLWIQWGIAKRRNGPVPIIFSFAGTLLVILAATTDWDSQWPKALGLGLLLLGASLQAMSFSAFNKLRWRIRECAYSVRSVFPSASIKP